MFQPPNVNWQYYILHIHFRGWSLRTWVITKTWYYTSTEVANPDEMCDISTNELTFVVTLVEIWDN